MTVAALIKKLSKLPPSSQVILQKDAEGNGFSPLHGAEEGYYIPESIWGGTVYAKKWSPSDCCLTDEEHSEMVKSKKAQCVVLWPVN